MQMKTQFGGLA